MTILGTPAKTCVRLRHWASKMPGGSETRLQSQDHARTPKGFAAWSLLNLTKSASKRNFHHRLFM